MIKKTKSYMMSKCNKYSKKNKLAIEKIIEGNNNKIIIYKLKR